MPRTKFRLSQLCELVRLSPSTPINDFHCKSKDLTDFFCNDALNYQKELLGQTYFFRHKKNKKIVCAFTLSNDSIKVSDLPESRKKKVRKNIPHEKHQRSYPAVLIGRLGVSIDFARKGIGIQVVNFIKSLCIIEDTNQCRFILVDSYNTEEAKSFYTHPENGFQYVFSTESQEREYYEIGEDVPLGTRFMYFDLKKWLDEIQQ